MKHSIQDTTQASEQDRERSSFGLKKLFHAARRTCVLTAYHGGRGLRKTLRICFKLALVLYFLLASFFLVLRYGVLPNVENYKTEILQFTSKKLGRQVDVGELKASWSGLNPQFSLRQLVIHDQAGKVVLSLPQVNARVSWWTLFFMDLRFVNIELVNPALNVKRDQRGRIEVAGFQIDTKTENHSDSAGLDWLLSQNELSIREGIVDWDDQLRGNPILHLSEVNFLMQSRWHQHRFALKAKPPQSIAAPIDVRGNFHQSVFSLKKQDLAAWSGELYSNLQQADLPAVQRYFEVPFKLERGIGEVRSWIKLEKGHVADFTADVRLLDVLGKFRKDLPVLDMAQVKGRIVASEHLAQNGKYLSMLFGQAGHSLALVDFTMQTREGLVLPSTTLKETFTPGSNGQGEKVELYAKSLDLHSLANFAEHLPIPPDQRRILLEVAPKGVLKDFTAKWQGTYPEISSYSIKGQFSNLEMQPLKAQLARPKTAKTPAKAAVPAIPGFDNLTGSVDASDKGGSFTLDSTDLVLQLPSYFVDPLMPFKRLQMHAQWRFEADDRFVLQIDRMNFQQDQAVGSLSGKHVLSMRSQAKGELDKGEVDIEGHLSGFDIKTINRYIPEQTPEHLRYWLTHALLDGTANDVVLRMKGKVDQFPFTQKENKNAEQGEFSVHGNLAKAKLNFLPGVMAKDGSSPFWPIIDTIKGSFVFDRARMDIYGDTAQTNGVALSKVKATIPNLLEHNAILQIDGVASGSIQGMLNYVKASPVDDWIGNFLHDTVASGNANLNLKLLLPLNSILDSKVNGQLQLQGVDTVLQPDLPQLTSLTGRIDFNERGVTLNPLKANMLGGSTIALGGSQKDGAIRIRIDGTASADGVRKHFAEMGLAPLLDSLSGEARYTTQVNVKRRQTEVIVESNLQGLAINLPQPLNKTAQDYVPLRFELSPDNVQDASELRDQIKLNAGAKLSAIYQRKKALDKNAKWTVVRGGIALNGNASLPENGLQLHVDAKSLDVDAWRKYVEVPISGRVGAGLAESKNANDFLQYVEPNAFSLVTDEVHVFGKKLEKIVLGASQQNGLWQANLDSKQASGFVTWNGLANSQTAGHIFAKLSRLFIPKSAASDVSDLLEGKHTAKQIPSVEIHVENFELFDKKFGKLELTANNSLVAQGREWHIDKLNLKNEDAELNASGKWISRGMDSQTSLNYVLDIGNAGKLLDRLDFSEVLKAGKGRLEGAVQWNGYPFDLDIPTMSGNLQLKLASGQFVKVDPGAAKLLGVLSMQSIPRRFTLDFRDVFSEGFAFDTIVGTAQIAHGVARTDNLKMSSINATVLMEGSADIAKESQDLHVALIPDVNAGAASVVYGLAVNPVIGLGTFLAQLLFRDPLKRALTEEYQITGPWKNPVVTKIENKERQQILEKQKLEQQKAEQRKVKTEGNKE